MLSQFLGQTKQFKFTSEILSKPYFHMKRILAALLLTASSSIAVAQSKNDILYFAEGPKEVSVTEVSENLIKYTYPNESAVYSVSKHLVSKIKFSSGREETFESQFSAVNGLEDVDKVFLTYNPDEVIGLTNKGDLYSKATGVTTLSSMGNVKDRSLEKMKTEAAMIGANVILISNSTSRGNYYGNENTPSQSTQTVFFGQAYTSQPKTLASFEGLEAGMNVHHFQTHSLNRNDFGPTMESASKYNEDRQLLIIQLADVREQDGKVYATVPGIKTKTGQLEVISLSDGKLTLMERHKNTIYNYVLLTEDNALLNKTPRVASNSGN